MQISLNENQWVTMWNLHNYLMDELKDIRRMPQGPNREDLQFRMTGYLSTIEELIPIKPPAHG